MLQIKKVNYNKTITLQNCHEVKAHFSVTVITKFLLNRIPHEDNTLLRSLVVEVWSFADGENEEPVEGNNCKTSSNIAHWARTFRQWIRFFLLFPFPEPPILFTVKKHHTAQLTGLNPHARRTKRRTMRNHRRIVVSVNGLVVLLPWTTRISYRDTWTY